MTGAVMPKDALLRFVLAPDGQVVPDLAGKLPGRGIWVTPRRDAKRRVRPGFCQPASLVEECRTLFGADPNHGRNVAKIGRKRGTFRRCLGGVEAQFRVHRGPNRGGFPKHSLRCIEREQR